MTDFDAGTGLRGYGRVLTYGPAVRPFAMAVVGRLPIAMSGLGMVVLIEHVRGNYSIAGVVTGAFALATAFGAPLWGRLMDRHGQPRVLVPTALMSAAAMAALSLSVTAGASNAVLLLLAALTGFAFPPVSPAMRAAWRVIFTGESSRQLGYALDASSVELIFVLGPLLLSVLVAIFPPQVPLLVSAALLVIGTVGYSLTRAARSTPRTADLMGTAVDAVARRPDHTSAPPFPDLAAACEGERLDRVHQTALTAPGIAGVLAVALLMAIGFGQMDTSIVATAGVVLGSTQQLGVLFAFIAGGSAIGGLVYGARQWPGDDPRRLVVTLSTFALSLVPWPFLLQYEHPPLPVLFGLLFVTGLSIAPSLIMFQGLLDQMSPPTRMTEAQALLSASQTTGAAVGTAIAGFTVDAWHAPGGIAGAAIAVGLGAVVTIVQQRWWRSIGNG